MASTPSLSTSSTSGWSSPLKWITSVLTMAGTAVTTTTTSATMMVPPSPASMEDPGMVDYLTQQDYRGFLFVVHEQYGLLLLYCSHKVKKGPHYQLPGGHVDRADFVKAAHESPNGKNELLVRACRHGAVRELYEETGIDLRQQLDRVQPARIRSDAATGEGGIATTSSTSTNSPNPTIPLSNEYKHRLFYVVVVNDQDFATTEGVPPQHPPAARHLKLQISSEHEGYTLELDPTKAMDMVQLHSGGKVSEALRMALELKSVTLPKERRSKYHKEGMITSSGRGGGDNCQEGGDRSTLLVPPPRAANKDGTMCWCFGR